MSTNLSEVKIGHVILSLLRGLSDKALKWATILMAFTLTLLVMARPNPWSAGVAAIFVALVSPLWLRKSLDS